MSTIVLSCYYCTAPRPGQMVCPQCGMDHTTCKFVGYPGEVVEKYTLLNILPGGGLSEVWKAKETDNVENIVVLKFLPPGPASKKARRRFDNELRMLTAVRHPNIVALHRSGITEDGRPYFVMEYVENGLPITTYCDTRQLSICERTKLMAEVCDAVTHIHKCRMLHLDLKPGNILVMEKRNTKIPVIKILDLGIARNISREERDKSASDSNFGFAGTLAYSAPEQFAGEHGRLWFSTDVYALGVIFYELLTGFPPVPPETIERIWKERGACLNLLNRVAELGNPVSAALVALKRPRASELWNQFVRGDKDRAIADRELAVFVPHPQSKTGLKEQIPVAPGITATQSRPTPAELAAARDCVSPGKLSAVLKGDLDYIASRALQGDTGNRYEDAGLLANDLRNYLRSDPLPKETRPHSIGYVSVKFLRKHTLSVVAATLILLSLVGGLATTLSQSAEKSKALDRAREATTRNLQILYLASMADYYAARKAFEEDAAAERKGERSVGLFGRSRWHEGVALLCRSLERYPGNRYAALRLHETLRYRLLGRRDWPERLLHEKFMVHSAGFSPDGRLIVTQSNDEKGEVRVFEAQTGESVGDPILHEGVNYDAFSPDGRLIVTMGSGVALVWDVQSRKALGDPIPHEGVESGAFSPDGRLIVTMGAGVAQVWDVKTRKALGDPIPHEGEESPTFSPDGRLLVTMGSGVAQVWDVDTKKTLGDPIPHEGVRSGAFSPDGRLIVTMGGGVAQVWDVPTETAVWEKRFSVGDAEPHPYFPSAAFSPDGRLIVTTHEGAVKVSDIQKETTVWEKKFFPDDTGPDLLFTSAAFSPDGMRIVTTGGGFAQVWDAATGNAVSDPLLLPERPDEGVVLPSAVFSPDGTRILTLEEDGTAKIWESQTGHEVGAPIPIPYNSNQFGDFSQFGKFSPDGTRILTVDGDNTVRVWEAATAGLIGEPLPHEESDLYAVFSPDGTRIFVGLEKTVRIWEVATSTKLGETEPCDFLTGLDVHPNGTRILSTNQDGTARIWDAFTGEPVGKPLLHNDTVNSAKFSPDGRTIVTATGNRSGRMAQIWETATCNPVGKPLVHRGFVQAAEFSPDGRTIVTHSHDGTARIWEASTGEPLGEPLSHKAPFGSASFSADGTRILTTDGEKTRVWTMISESEILPGISPEVLRWTLAAAGIRYNEFDEPVLIPDDERLLILNPSNAAALPAGPWRELAVWIATTRESRTSELRSSASLRQVAERERDYIGTGTVASLESALRYDPTVPLARLLLAAALENADAIEAAEKQDITLPQRAAFLRRYDLDRLPENAALWARAARSLNEAPETALVGLGPNAIPVRREALAAAERALEVQPGLPSGLREKGRALESLQRHAEALAVQRELLRSPEAAVEDFTRAGYLAAQQKDSAASLIIKEAETRFPKDASIYCMAGWAYLKLTDHPAALRAFAGARALLPADQEPDMDLLAGSALAHWLDGQSEKAIAYCRELITREEEWSASRIGGWNWPEAEKQIEAILSATLSRYPELGH